MMYFILYLGVIYVMALIAKERKVLRLTWSFFHRKRPSQRFPWLSLISWATAYCLSLATVMFLLYILRWLNNLETSLIIGAVAGIWLLVLVYFGVQLTADVYFSGVQKPIHMRSKIYPV